MKSLQEGEQISDEAYGKFVNTILGEFSGNFQRFNP